MSRPAARLYRPLKIAITGTHGTGKTTLIRALAASLQKNGLTVEIAQEFGRRYIDFSGDPARLQPGAAKPERQILSLFHTAQEESRAARTAPDIILCDRGIIDCYVYSLAVGVDFDPVDLAFMTQLVQDHAQSYDAVIRLPIAFPMPYDGVRPADIAFQRAIDTEIQKQWRAAGVNPHLIDGSVPARVAQTTTLIHDLIRRTQGPRHNPAPPIP